MLTLSKLNSAAAQFSAQLHALLTLDLEEDAAIDQAVAQILKEVKQHGDKAVLQATHRFDRLKANTIAELTIPNSQLEAAFTSLSQTQRLALEAAAERIRLYHQRQLVECGGHSWQYIEADGTALGQKVTPLDRVGLYVPGGKAAYPSSVLMNALPAKIAGVTDITMVTPTPDGIQNPLVLAAAWVAGVNRVITIGGAQAVAALAYGTQSIAQVDKIVGPGNAYVAAAKRRVFGTVGIDMIAGPSEILVIADGTTDPHWIAMDLCAQAEHDELAQSILLCPNADYLNQVEQCLAQALTTLPRAQTILKSLNNRGALIQVRNLDEACDIANAIAPEHLELSVDNPQPWLSKLRHAGAIFLGCFTSESLGDYCAGPNHVLPTSRTARFSSPLGVYDFFKRSSIIQVSQQGANTLGHIASTLAHGEGLQAHARAAELRLKD